MNIGIILAAGVGKRFKSDIPKQFLTLNNKPVLYYTMKSFIDSLLFDKIIVVVSAPYIDFTKSIIEEHMKNNEFAHICEGGKTRQDSLYNGVKFAKDNFCDKDHKIVSHCAARPILTKKILLDNIEMIEYGKTVDTVKRIYDTMLYTSDENNIDFIDRDKLFIGLTPQSFYASDYIKAYDKNKHQIEKYTCACSLMKDSGFELKLLITEEPVHKITVKDDLKIVEKYLKEM